MAEQITEQGIAIPTVGRIVHFHRNHSADPQAAIVTNVYVPGSLGVELHVFPCSWYGSAHYETSVPHRSVAVIGQSFWDWPPRV